MAPSKPKRNNSKATSAGPTSARTYRRQPRENQVEPQDETTQSEPQPQAEVKFKREEDDDGYDDDTVAASFETNKPRPPAVISTRQHDFSERSWWMVDVDGPTDESPTQGATALVKRCMRAYGWDLPKTRKILNAYKQFLVLKKKLKDWDATLISPCHWVDQMWHQHILDNFNYYHDMILLCGRFVGHNPDGALSLQAKVVRDQTTRIRLREHFGRYDADIWDQRAPLYAGADSTLDDRPITIRVKDQTGEETMFKIKMFTRMSKVFGAYAQGKGVELASLRFTLENERIGPEETPRNLDLEEDDIIDVMLTQCGC